MPRALIIVDVQPTFCEGGALPVTGGNAIAEAVAAYVDAHRDEYQLIVTTQDWHIDPGSHFSDTPDFVDSWPVHCVAKSKGAQIHENLDTDYIEAYFRKGRYEAAYSGFEGLLAPEDEVATGEHEPGADASEDGPQTPLSEWLDERGIEYVDVVGIATDYCVAATARDAVDAGYETRVLIDLTAPVHEDKLDETAEALEADGVEVVEVL